MARLEEHDEYCRHVVDDLLAVIEGRAYKCYNCGEIIYLEDYADIDDVHFCPKCSAEDVGFEQFGLIDYFIDSIYDIKYIIDDELQYSAVIIMIACGGPNVYVDTYNEKVNLYWWNESGSASLYSEVCNAIDELWEEFYNDKK